MSNPQPPQGGDPQQPFNQGPHTPPGGQQPPPFGQQPQGQPFPGQQPPQGQPFPGQGQQQFPGQPGQPFPGQEPPQGQPFPGQQPPPPFGQQPQQPGFPGAAPGQAPSGKGKMIKLIAGIVVLLVIGGGAFYFFNKSAASAAVGDCIKVKSASATDADVEKIDCGKPDAVFKVAKKLDSGSANCPQDSDYLEYEQTGKSSSSGFSLCLMVNAKVGECLTDLRDAETAVKVDCGDPKAKLEITTVAEGETEYSACPEDADDGFKYNEPKVVICGKKK
ncbi:LppU/SCO3897 family protein [Actinokineospora sp. HUAS TT18]|uniref:LppU/SCO3897 family protein n=1 Tax=Actinokineospora sp. HUAS TT18 TaxID=3447451 RepID=UPI003F528603